MFRLTVRKQTSPHFLVIRKSAAIALAEYCNDTADSERKGSSQTGFVWSMVAISLAEMACFNNFRGSLINSKSV